MKMIYESPLNGWDESAERLYVYELESDEEYWEFYEMTFEEKCDFFRVFDQTGYFVMPGAKYYTYEFKLTSNHIIMFETVAYNV
jgi:hypothetical protein